VCTSTIQCTQCTYTLWSFDKTRQHALVLPQAYPVTPGRHAMVLSVAVCYVACCVWPIATAHALLSIVSGMTQQFIVFCPWWPWPLTLTFELGRDFCTMYLTAKFDRPMFSRSEIIVRQTYWQNDKHTHWQANKPTPLKISTSLRYTTPVDENIL